MKGVLKIIRDPPLRWTVRLSVLGYASYMPKPRIWRMACGRDWYSSHYCIIIKCAKHVTKRLFFLHYGSIMCSWTIPAHNHATSKPFTWAFDDKNWRGKYRGFSIIFDAVCSIHTSRRISLTSRSEVMRCLLGCRRVLGEFKHVFAPLGWAPSYTKPIWCTSAFKHFSREWMPNTWLRLPLDVVFHYILKGNILSVQ